MSEKYSWVYDITDVEILQDKCFFTLGLLEEIRRQRDMCLELLKDYARSVPCTGCSGVDGCDINPCNEILRHRKVVKLIKELEGK